MALFETAVSAQSLVKCCNDARLIADLRSFAGPEMTIGLARQKNTQLLRIRFIPPCDLFVILVAGCSDDEPRID
jgi:hypothetical protein